MRVTFRSTLPQDKVVEGSQFNVYVKFWDNDGEPWVVKTPTSIRYRVMTGYNVIRDWTTVTPATSATISITATDNAMINPAIEREVKELVVQCDNGLDTQYADTFDWTVQNITAI